MLNIPSWNQFKRLPSVLAKKERYFILGLFLILIISLILWIVALSLSNTILVPKHGGSFKEGIVGSPQYLNPVLSETSDADRDTTQLIFSGLMKYNSNNELVTDLAEKYSIDELGKTYDFFLRKDIKWHDNESFTVDDIIFTIQLIQNPEYRSPLRINWTGVEIEKIDDYTVRFKLKTPYAPFLTNTTVGILPKHIWENIPADSFAFTEQNLLPIGTGPYVLKKLKKDREGFISFIELKAFDNFKPHKPYIEKIELSFYLDEESLIRAYNKGKIDNINLSSVRNKSLLTGINDNKNIYKLNLPRYFAIFFNQSKSKALSDKQVRLALNYATDKQTIINEVLNGEAKPAYSPIPFGDWENTEVEKYEFDLEKAKQILTDREWTDENEDGIRERGTIDLEIELITTELKELQQVANLLQEQWSKLDAKITVKILNIGEIQQEHIRPRDYQALLFGQVLGSDPDPFAFWHSSQKKDPGLNLCLYDNSKVDTLLKNARQNLDNEERKQEYKDFQEIVVNDVPGIFLYSSYNLYFVNKKVKGIESENIVLPSKRFNDIEEWYIKTKREKNETIN